MRTRAPERARKRAARKSFGPLFVFVASSTVAGLLGHGALLACASRGASVEWKASESPEVKRQGGMSDADRLAFNRESQR